MAGLASAISELTRRFDAMELRAPTAGAPGASPPVASVGRPAARLEVVERHLELLTSLVQDASRGGCERQEAARALEEGVAQVAGQIRRGEARAELHALQARESLWALRCRVERLEAALTSTRAEVITPPVVPEGALARLANRLDALEAGMEAKRSLREADATFEHLNRRPDEGQQHTHTRLATLGGEPAGPEQPVRLAGGTAPAPAAGGLHEKHRGPPLTPIDGQAKAAAPAERDATLDVIEAAVRELAEQVAGAEQRSSRTVSRMGHEVVRVAQHLDGRVEQVERRSDARALELGAELGRLSRVVEDRLERADHVQIDALRTIGGQIATIAAQLMDRITASELTSAATVARGLAGVTEQLQLTSDSLHRFGVDAQDRAARLHGNESQFDGLSTPAGSQAEAVDLQPLVLGEAERKIPSAAATPTSSRRAQQAPTKLPQADRPGRTQNVARQELASSPSPFERMRADLDRGRDAERTEPSETGSSLQNSTPDKLENANPPLSTGAGDVPGLVDAPSYARGTRELIDAARAAARSAAETSSRGARAAAILHLDPRANAPPGAPNVLRAGLSLLRERARAR